ncbi:MAG: hypothetical protein ACLSAH_18245 [Bilophila wadsworthia]
MSAELLQLYQISNQRNAPRRHQRRAVDGIVLTDKGGMVRCQPGVRAYGWAFDEGLWAWLRRFWL